MRNVLTTRREQEKERRLHISRLQEQERPEKREESLAGISQQPYCILSTRVPLSLLSSLPLLLSHPLSRLGCCVAVAAASAAAAQQKPSLVEGDEGERERISRPKARQERGERQRQHQEQEREQEEAAREAGRQAGWLGWLTWRLAML